LNNLKFIAEVSSNHNQDIKRCKQFIKTAKKVGCDGIKFQLFKIDQLFATEILENNSDLRKRKEWELPIEFIPELQAFSHDYGLEFSCTPFYLGAVDELKPYVDFFKIASYELLWDDLFIKCAKTGLPIVFSTGMAKLPEIQETLNSLIREKSKDITVLHCNSAYPTPLADANLAGIETLQKMIKLVDKPDDTTIRVGYSDHTVSPAVLYRAVHQYDVSFIEFHLDLDSKGIEYAAGHCWLPEQIANVIKNVQDGLFADGDGKIEPSKSELNEREWRADPSDGLRPLLHTRKHSK
jgi:N-acetylneuraminate synthase